MLWRLQHFYFYRMMQQCLGSCKSVCLPYACFMTGTYYTMDILIPHVRKITLVFWYRQRLVGYIPFHLKFALEVIHPHLKNIDFNRFPLISSQPYNQRKSLIITNRKSITGFLTSHIEVCTLPPNPPKGGLKSEFAVFVNIIQLTLNKVCYDVSFMWKLPVAHL